MLSKCKYNTFCINMQEFAQKSYIIHNNLYLGILYQGSKKWEKNF